MMRKFALTVGSLEIIRLYHMIEIPSSLEGLPCAPKSIAQDSSRCDHGLSTPSTDGLLTLQRSDNCDVSIRIVPKRHYRMF